jgi:hypothetical protein
MIWLISFAPRCYQWGLMSIWATFDTAKNKLTKAYTSGVVSMAVGTISASSGVAGCVRAASSGHPIEAAFCGAVAVASVGFVGTCAIIYRRSKGATPNP